MSRTRALFSSFGGRAGKPFSERDGHRQIRKGIDLLPISQKRVGLQDWLDIEVRAWFAGRILPVTETIAERWGQLAAATQKQGVTLAVVDGVIAATALEHLPHGCNAQHEAFQDPRRHSDKSRGISASCQIPCWHEV
jgi:hypothetical protein